MKLALLVPSRERIQKKLELVNSLKETTASLDDVTLYFGIDTDDPTREEVYEIARANKFVRVVDIQSTGKFQNLGILWNTCARATTEDVLGMVGDDMTFESIGWDDTILNDFEQGPKDHFLMVHCNDGKQGARIAVNAFVHRRYMELTGYFMREEFPVDKIDIWLQQIFSAFDRLKYHDDILIEHRHWSFGKSKFDKVAQRMRSDNAEQRSICLWEQLLPARLQEAETLSKALNLPFNREKINNGLAYG